jgi:hypothetical protein
MRHEGRRPKYDSGGKQEWQKHAGGWGDGQGVWPGGQMGWGWKLVVSIFGDDGCGGSPGGVPRRPRFLLYFVFDGARSPRVGDGLRRCAKFRVWMSG